LLGYAIGMVIGGAIGNVVDRLFRDQRAVADFLDLHLAGYHWPAFNLADTGITIGATILIIDSLFMKPEKPKNNRGKEKTDVR
jgi:signal peptidase II